MARGRMLAGKKADPVQNSPQGDSGKARDQAGSKSVDHGKQHSGKVASPENLPDPANAADACDRIRDAYDRDAKERQKEAGRTYGRGKVQENLPEPNRDPAAGYEERTLRENFPEGGAPATRLAGPSTSSGGPNFVPARATRRWQPPLPARAPLPTTRHGPT
jgi:hypothetical protein